MTFKCQADILYNIYQVHLSQNKQNNIRTINEIDNYEIVINPET
jgi:hypothetical protein